MSSNKYSDADLPGWEQSPRQLQPYQLELYEHGLPKRSQQMKSYPPILPNTLADIHPSQPHASKTQRPGIRKAKGQGNIRACDTCRKKKIRCIGNGSGSTCKNCRSNNIECTYNESAKKRGPPKGYKADLNNRLKRLEALLGGLANDRRLSPTTDDDTSTATSPTTTLISAHSALPPTACLTNNLSTFNSRDNGTSHPSKRFQQKYHTTIEGQPVYVHDAGILPFLAEKFNLEDERLTTSIEVKIRRFGKSMVLIEEEKDASNGRTLNQILLEDIGLLKPGEPVLGMEDWIWKVAGITKKTSDYLMKIYFYYIHPGLPVVDKKVLLNQYRGLASDYPAAPLLNAIYGAASRFIEKCQAIGTEDSAPDIFDNNMNGWELPKGGSEGFYDNLINFVKGSYASSISTVQAIVIAQHHRATTENGVPCDWLFCTTAVRMAQDLGLQRSSEILDICDNEKETRRRIWWGVYIIDKWAAASTGKPQTVFDEDCDQEYPSECAPWEEVMDVASGGETDDQQPRFPSLDPSVAKSVKGEKVPLYQPFVQIAKLSEILGRILQGLYTPLAKKHSAVYGSDVIVTELDKSLSDWRTALPPTLQLSGAALQNLNSRGKTPLISISVLLYLAYCTLLILLHRPFIVRRGTPKTKSSESSLSICLSAAARCVDVASSLQPRDYIILPWNFVVYYVFTASMILGHTAIYSDSVTSDLASTQLNKGLRVINSLSRFSTKASQLHQVLLQLMRVGDLQLDDPPSDSNTHHLTSQQQHSDDATQENETLPSTALDINEATDDKITGLQDFTMNEIRRERSAMNIEFDSQSVSDFIQQRDDLPKNANTIPTPMMDGDWINGLYSSFQQEDMQDPNSLQQFGLNIEQMFTPSNHLNSMDYVSNTLPINQSQQLAYATTGLPQNFLFGLTEKNVQQQNTDGSNLFTDISSSSASQQHGKSGDSALLRSDDFAPAMDNSLFRNQPDNPFWSVPSSIEMDDWNTFLLQLSFKYNGNS